MPYRGMLTLGMFEKKYVPPKRGTSQLPLKYPTSGVHIFMSCAPGLAMPFQGIANPGLQMNNSLREFASRS